MKVARDLLKAERGTAKAHAQLSKQVNAHHRDRIMKVGVFENDDIAKQKYFPFPHSFDFDIMKHWAFETFN
jgi:hypothetical protein